MASKSNSGVHDAHPPQNRRCFATTRRLRGGMRGASDAAPIRALRTAIDRLRYGASEGDPQRQRLYRKWADILDADLQQGWNTLRARGSHFPWRATTRGHTSFREATFYAGCI